MDERISSNIGKIVIDLGPKETLYDGKKFSELGADKQKSITDDLIKAKSEEKAKNPNWEEERNEAGLGSKDKDRGKLLQFVPKER